MADFSASSWKEDDNLNTAPSPNGMKPGSQSSEMYPITRNLMGASVRMAHRSSFSRLSTGTSTAYVVTYDVFAAYTIGEPIRFFAHAANTGGIHPVKTAGL